MGHVLGVPEPAMVKLFAKAKKKSKSQICLFMNKTAIVFPRERGNHINSVPFTCTPSFEPKFNGEESLKHCVVNI